MIGLGRPSGRWMVAVCSAALAVAMFAVPGCGNNGDAGITLPRTPKPDVPALTGVVEEPNGELASADWLRWPDALRILPRAFAAQNVFTVPDGIPVILSLVDSVDAADGVIGNLGGHTPQLIQQVFTDPDGRYEIIDPALGNVDACRLMVAVGGSNTPLWTRAFVYNTVTNIDYRSEALVHVVLQRLTRAPAVQLCDFTSSGLQNIFDAVDEATPTATGDDVAHLNFSAFLLADANCGVKRAIDRATGVPVRPPDPKCASTP